MVISIVTLNYKKKELTLACMTSLFEQFAQEFAQDKIELIIVDNDSQDDSVDVLNQEITTKGAQASIGDYILFLNNDTVVKDKSIFEMAHFLATHSEASILGGQMKNFDGTLQPCAGTFYTLWPAFLLLIGGHKLGLLDKSPKQVKKVDWVKGGMLLIRKEVFKRLGGFDEKIFMYIEDMELCYRASQSGYAVYFFPNAFVLHKDQGSSNKTFAIVNIYKNLLYFYQKHRSKREYAIMKSMLVIKANLLLTIGNMTKNAYLMETYQKALDGI